MKEISSEQMQNLVGGRDACSAISMFTSGFGIGLLFGPGTQLIGAAVSLVGGLTSLVCAIAD